MHIEKSQFCRYYLKRRNNQFYFSVIVLSPICTILYNVNIEKSLNNLVAGALLYALAEGEDI